MKTAAILCALFCAVAAVPSTPSTDPSDYGLFRRIPDGCDPSTNCTYFVGMEVNSDDRSYLDFIMTGEAEGWLAIGFSTSRSMQDSDVVGCIVDSDGMVEAIDTYNEVAIFNNTIDTGGQGDIMLQSGEVVGRRMNCTFSRLIAGLQPSEDRNLNGTFFFLFGFDVNDRRDGNGGFPKHITSGPARPTILGQFNPTVTRGEILIPERNVTVPTPDGIPQRLTRRTPAGCNPEDCEYFMGIATNTATDEYLDFYLTAEIGGWIAIGFSDTANMLDADVVGCNRDSSTDEVFAVDAHNPQSPRTNIADNTQDVVRHSFTSENGRITCVFSRKVVGTDDSVQDRDLNDDYFFLFGDGADGGGRGSFPNHLTRIPQISDGRFNPFSDEGEIGISRFRQRLLQAHGILMLIAWPVLAFTAIFFAAWMKQALPNGEWFQVHRAFHIAALVVAFVGFILAFIANKDSSTPGLIELGSQNKSGTAHFVLGIIIMALQIANPIISIFRCKPTGEYRWIFNLIHGFLIGLGVEFLAYTNIGIGVSLFSETQSDFGDLTIFWVYLAFAIFGVVLNSALLLFFTCEAGIKGEEGVKLAPAVTKPFFNKVYGSANASGGGKEVEMSRPGEPAAPAGPPARKPPSADAPFRWLGLGIFLGIMLPLIFSVIVMIAATGNTD